jgi:menaquinone-dependent protoporphyrinogen oxidase
LEKILLLHSSTDGQTIKILNYIKEKLGSEVECELQNLNLTATVDFSRYDRIMIGGSIRYGHLNKKLYQFIEKNLQDLQQNKVAFFCVNLTARKIEKNTPETNAYMKTFLSKSKWIPELQAVFAGALYYPRYKWVDRVMIQLIMRITGGETDTSKEVEYTDWNKVEQFAIQFKSF